MGFSPHKTMQCKVQHPGLYYKGLMTGKTVSDQAFTWYQNGVACDAPKSDGYVLQIYFLIVRETVETSAAQVQFVSYSTAVATHTDLTIPYNCAAGEQFGFDGPIPHVAGKSGETIGVTITGSGTVSVEVTARLVPKD